MDKKSGESLDDVNIRYQLLTFLIAGHETTSGLLSFAIYFLLKHPDVLARANDEVWRLSCRTARSPVCGDASKMAPAVRRAFTSVYCAETGSTESAAESWLADLDAAGRYIADVWAA